MRHSASCDGMGIEMMHWTVRPVLTGKSIESGCTFVFICTVLMHGVVICYGH